MAALLGRLLFAGVFLSAGIHKLANFDFDTVRLYFVLSPPLS